MPVTSGPNYPGAPVRLPKMPKSNGDAGGHGADRGD